MGIGELIRRSSVRFPDAIALIDRGRTFSHSNFNLRVNRLANGLLSKGLRKGDRLASFVDNGHVALEVLGAAAKGGFILVPINPRSSGQELTHFLNSSGSKGLVLGDEQRATFNEVRTTINDLGILVTTTGRSDDAGSYETLLSQASSNEPDIDIEDSDLFGILYTGGTTGRSRGVVSEHAQLLTHGAQMVQVYELQRESRFLLLLPHTSAGAINVQIVPCLMVGCTLVMDDVRRFEAERFLRNVEQYAITHTQMVPTMIYRILEDESASDYDVSSLQTIGYGSAVIPPDRVNKMLSRFGNILVQTYGMTEAGGVGVILSKEDHQAAMSGAPNLLASCGRVLPGIEVRVVDESGKQLSTGEAGEIVFRGSYVSRGLWNEPALTKELIRGGWLYSGDVGRFDEKEYLYLTDRKKDLIISGGFNISSSEVEETLYQHPELIEAAVVGIESEEWGETVYAVVVLRRGGEASPKEIIDFCRSRLAHYKCPVTVEIRSALPKSPMGKILKRQLKEEISSSLTGTRDPGTRDR